jgi:hypothetical protein
MSRVIFNNQPDPPDINQGRADIACFVGLVRVLPGASVPASSAAWLKTLGYTAAQIANIQNVPVLLETWAAFNSIFDSGGTGSAFGTDYLAATVSTFFAQGGRRCYVVRVGDPIASLANDPARTKELSAKLKTLLPNISYSANIPSTRTGVCSLAVLEDVSFLVTPDLAILSASIPAAATGEIPTIPTGPEQFVECAQADITPQPFRLFNSPAPRLSTADYGKWAISVAAILNFLASGGLRNELHLREMQFVTAFPLPHQMDPAIVIENPSAEDLAQDIRAIVASQLPEFAPPEGVVPAGNISSAFLQLCYPWLKTTGSHVLLESLEPPDGALTGLLARNALTRGTFTSAKVTPSGIYDVWPALPAHETKSSATKLIWNNQSPKPLIERLSLFGFTPTGLRLLSDVTAYPGESYRSGPVNRLVAVICRASRLTGEATIFERNGPALWGRVQRSLQNLMTRLWTLNALDGTSVKDAFSVRCDKSTMTQNDLDNGRVLADVTFNAASTIETIRVQLAMQTGGTSGQQITANLAEAS